MFSRLMVVGLASLALACGIALIFYKLLGASNTAAAKVKIRNVVVATADLPGGAKIQPQDLRIVSVPLDLAPRDCFEKTNDVAGRIVTSLVLKDEPIVPNRLASPGSGPGLAPMIPAGYRAVSVRVNDVIGVSGFIQPGMRVDVLATGHLPNTEDSVTRTVLQNVAVLSAGQVLQPEPKGQVINAQVVTLQVRPDEAEILTLTSGEGRIQLVLRNSSDTAVAQTHGAHLIAIYNVGDSGPRAIVSPHADRPASARPAAPAPFSIPVVVPAPPRTIEVIRGTTRSDVAIQDKGQRRKISELLYAAPASA